MTGDALCLLSRPGGESSSERPFLSPGFFTISRWCVCACRAKKIYIKLLAKTHFARRDPELRKKSATSCISPRKPSCKCQHSLGQETAESVGGGWGPILRLAGNLAGTGRRAANPCSPGVRPATATCVTNSTNSNLRVCGAALDMECGRGAGCWEEDAAQHECAVVMSVLEDVRA